MTCPVCDGAEFVKAAPVARIGYSSSEERKAVWKDALVVPCFACGWKSL